MAPFRCALGSVAVAWCLCYLSGVTLAPVMALVAGAEALECTCVHGDHSVCPMHRTSTGERRCVIQGPADGLEGSVISAFGLSDFVMASAVPAAPPVSAPDNPPAIVLPRSPNPTPYLRPPRT
jgi:hypothetical protein